MDQGLLYEFSTIAQALGGAFALLAAFVLYRFQSLSASMSQDSKGLWSPFAQALAAAALRDLGDLLWYEELRIRGQFAELVRRIEEIDERKRCSVETPKCDPFA